MKTLVIGASPNPERYAYKAVHKLQSHGFDAIPFGIKKGEVAGKSIVNDPQLIPSDIDTITLYIGPDLQGQYEPLIFSLNPRRVIFNPGTENQKFESALENKGIEPIRACTLVMLATGNY